MKTLLKIVIFAITILWSLTGIAAEYSYLNNDAVHYAKTENNCTCKHKETVALLGALESCLDVLAAQEICRGSMKRNFESVKTTDSSCKCREKINTALVKSLKSCTEAIEYNTMCPNSTASLAPLAPLAPPSRKTYISCAEIKEENPNSKSGNYEIIVNGKPMKVYCNMDTLCRASGWIKLGSFNMSDGGSICPTGLSEYTVSGVRMCGRPAGGSGCNSIMISSNNISYSRVCGRVKGYQGYTTGGFHHFINNINSAYLDGISITRGSPRQHIWSLGSGYTERHTNNWGCPCNEGADKDAKPPSFVGNHYYCESGTIPDPVNRFYPEDPLWDGKLCRGREEPCCPSGSLRPWFDRDIGTTTTDHIEIRLCTDEVTSNENIAIGQYEFYVM